MADGAARSSRGLLYIRVANPRRLDDGIKNAMVTGFRHTAFDLDDRTRER